MAQAVRKKANRIASALAKADKKLPWLKYFVFLYAYLLVYSISIVCHGHMWKLDEACYTYHLADFDFGFCTRLLLGAVFRLIFGNPSFNEVYVTESVLIVTAYAVICGLLSRLLVSLGDSKTRFAFLTLCIFFLSGPTSFGGFVNQLGMLDAHWLYLSLVFLLVLETKYLKYITPALVFLMIMIHYASMVTYIIFCCMVLLYRITIEQSKAGKRQYAAIFALTVFVAIVSFVYFQIFEETNVRVTMEEMDRELIARAYPHTKDAASLRFYNFAFFRDEMMHHGSEYGVYLPYEAVPTVNLPLPEPVNKIINMIVSQAFVNFNVEKEKILKAFYIPYLLLCSLPLIAVVYRIRIKLFRAEKNRLKKICHFLALVQYPFCAVSGLLFSNDVTRFLIHAYVILLAYLLYNAYREENVRLAIKEAFYRLDKRMVCAYLFVFMLATADTYV